MGFSTRLLTGKAEGTIESTASGNIVKQLFGIEILLLGVMLLLFTHSKRLRSTLWCNKIWLLLILFFVVSISWSEIPIVSLRRLIALLTLIICSLVIAVSFELKSLLLYLSDAIFVAAILGLIMIIVAPSIAMVDQVNAGRTNTFFGKFFDKNGGARCYAYALLIRIGYTKIYRKFDIFKLIVLVLCIVMANSATAIVMLVIGISAILSLNLLHSKNKINNLKRVLLVIILGIVAGSVVNYAYEFLLQLLGRDPTLTNRAFIWQLITPFVEQKFALGYGFGAFWASNAAEDFVTRWEFIGNAHSGYYEAMLNGGVICLSIVTLLIFKIIRDCFSIYINDIDGKLVTPILSIIIIQAVVNYVGYLILNYNSADMFFFTTLAFSASCKERDISEFYSNDKL